MKNLLKFEFSIFPGLGGFFAFHFYVEDFFTGIIEAV